MYVFLCNYSLTIYNWLQRYCFFSEYANFRVGKIVGKVFLPPIYPEKQARGLRMKDSSREDERKVRRATERSGVWAKERDREDAIERRIVSACKGQTS